MKDGGPMRVCVERYGYLPTDKAAFKGEIPAIRNMVPFDFYIKRKLCIHNMGHATCAYLGDVLGLPYIYQSIDVPDVRILVQNAMTESAMALSKKYGVALDGILLHITDLLHRFTNAALKDTCRQKAEPRRTAHRFFLTGAPAGRDPSLRNHVRFRHISEGSLWSQEENGRTFPPRERCAQVLAQGLVQGGFSGEAKSI